MEKIVGSEYICSEAPESNIQKVILKLEDLEVEPLKDIPAQLAAFAPTSELEDTV